MRNRLQGNEECVFVKVPNLVLTRDEMIRVINNYQGWEMGLCHAFSTVLGSKAYDILPKFLKAIGGRSSHDFFWHSDTWDEDLPARELMLAFMLTWVEDLEAQNEHAVHE